MRLEPGTLAVLKNFAAINPALSIRKGTLLRTMSPTRSIVAHATVAQEFECDFAIYNLPTFLSAVSMFSTTGSTASIEPSEESVRIFSDNQRLSGRSIEYRCCDPKLISDPIEESVFTKIMARGMAASFKLTAEQIESVRKGVSVLGLPELSVRGDGKNVYLEAVDSKKTSSSYSSIVGETDKKFVAYVSESDFKLLPVDFEVQLSSSGFAFLEGTSAKYWLALGPHSKFA